MQVICLLGLTVGSWQGAAEDERDIQAIFCRYLFLRERYVATLSETTRIRERLKRIDKSAAASALRRLIEPRETDFFLRVCARLHEIGLLSELKDCVRTLKSAARGKDPGRRVAALRLLRRDTPFLAQAYRDETDAFRRAQILLYLAEAGYRDPVLLRESKEYYRAAPGRFAKALPRERATLYTTNGVDPDALKVFHGLSGFSRETFPFTFACGYYTWKTGAAEDRRLLVEVARKSDTPGFWEFALLVSPDRLLSRKLVKALRSLMDHHTAVEGCTCIRRSELFFFGPRPVLVFREAPGGEAAGRKFTLPFLPEFDPPSPDPLAVALEATEGGAPPPMKLAALPGYRNAVRLMLRSAVHRSGISAAAGFGSLGLEEAVSYLLALSGAEKFRLEARNLESLIRGISREEEPARSAPAEVWRKSPRKRDLLEALLRLSRTEETPPGLAAIVSFLGPEAQADLMAAVLQTRDVPLLRRLLRAGVLPQDAVLRLSRDAGENLVAMLGRERALSLLSGNPAFREEAAKFFRAQFLSATGPARWRYAVELATEPPAPVRSFVLDELERDLRDPEKREGLVDRFTPFLAHPALRRGIRERTRALLESKDEATRILGWRFAARILGEARWTLSEKDRSSEYADCRKRYRETKAGAEERWWILVSLLLSGGIRAEEFLLTELEGTKDADTIRAALFSFGGAYLMKQRLAGKEIPAAARRIWR